PLARATARPPAMSTVIESLERAQLRRVPAFQPGDRVKVHFQVIEGTRRRTQVFEGVVIKRQGHGVRETFTVRKQSFGVGVERTFPVHSPKIERIEVSARGDVRRAKLYYLRERVGKRARVRERRYTGPEERIEPGLLHDPVAQLEAEAALSDGAVDEVGEIVAFHPPTGAEGEGDTCGDPNRPPIAACDKPTPQKAGVNFIKRVVGLPGDKISIRDGHVIRNGKREADGYTNPCAGGSACNLPQTITIPHDHYFMMGDNRGASDDSRYWGPVRRQWTMGGTFDKRRP